MPSHPCSVLSLTLPAPRKQGILFPTVEALAVALAPQFNEDDFNAYSVALQAARCVPPKFLPAFPPLRDAYVSCPPERAGYSLTAPVL